jgi:hypothetical protein
LIPGDFDSGIDLPRASALIPRRLRQQQMEVVAVAVVVDR